MAPGSAASPRSAAETPGECQLAALPGSAIALCQIGPTVIPPGAAPRMAALGPVGGGKSYETGSTVSD
jgi:hypothetical protein